MPGSEREQVLAFGVKDSGLDNLDATYIVCASLEVLLSSSCRVTICLQ